MRIKNLALTNFRSYKKTRFDFFDTTIIVGRNTIGKTNILEAMHMLTTGKSFRAEKDVDTISLFEDFARIEAQITDENDITELTLIMVKGPNGFSKRFLINGVGKRQSEFKTILPTVLFAPNDLEIISGSPYYRRRYIDSILFQADIGYKHAETVYDKALKQRNKLLHTIKSGERIFNVKEFEYWNSLLLEKGKIITQKRSDYVEYLNSAKKNVFDFQVQYDKSEFSQERIEKYHDSEIAAGVTLIGPQRDDFLLFLSKKTNFPSGGKAIQSLAKGEHSADQKTLNKEYKNGLKIAEYASRGEQRLTMLQLKLLEIEFLKTALAKNPVLLLDDIYSELDADNIALVTNLLPYQQTIITTTHLDFIPKHILKNATLLNLEDREK